MNTQDGDQQITDQINEMLSQGVPQEQVREVVRKQLGGEAPQEAPDPGDQGFWEMLAETPELFGQGLSNSSTAILTGNAPGFQKVRERAKRDYNWFQRAVLGLGQVTGDLPTFFLGEVAGGANPITGTVLGFGLVGAIRSSWDAYQEFLQENPGSEFTFGDFIEKIPQIAAETGKESLVGLATGGAGKFLGKFLTKPGMKSAFGVRTTGELGQELIKLTGKGEAVKAVGELGALTTAGAFKEGEFPTTQSFIDNLLVLGGLKLTHLAGSRLLKAAKKGNKDPTEMALKLSDKDAAELGKAEITDPTILKILDIREKERVAAEEKVKGQAVRELQPVKDKVPSDDVVVNQRKNTLETVPKKNKNAQDYKVVGEPEPHVDIPRNVSENSEVMQENAIQLNELAAHKTKTVDEQTSWLNSVSDAYKGVMGKVFVDVPLDSIGAPETAFHVKNYPSKQTVVLEKIKDAQKKLVKLGIKGEKESQLFLFSEFEKLPKGFEEFKEAHKVVRDVFDKFGNELKTKGAFKELYPQSRIKGNELIIKELKKRLEGITSKKEREKIKKTIERLSIDNEILKKISYVHLPTSLWFEDFYSKNPMRGSKVLRILSAKKRKTLSMADLLETGIIKESDINTADILGSYGPRVARDLATLDIINSAKKEGLVSDRPVQGFVQLPGFKYPLLANWHAHPAFADFLFDYTRTEPQGLLASLLGKAKGFAFFNPIILPMYDMFQSMMAVGPFKVGKELIKVPFGKGNFAEAAKAMWKRDDIYYKALEDGLASSPYSISFTDFQAELNLAKAGNPFMEFAADFMSKENVKSFGLKALYNASQQMAWFGDRLIRMTTYLELLKGGRTSRESAQIAAKFHGDYAAVNPKTRRQLNKIFFTPTFKLVMGRLHGGMIKAVASKFFSKKSLEGYKLKERDALAMGLVNTAAIIMGTHLLMKSLGFDTDQWGRSYKKTLDTDEGKKELVLSFSNPANLPLKFLWRGISSLNPLNANPLKSFLRANRWELNPVWRVGQDIVNNKGSDFNPIYSNYGDSSSIKAGKSALYAFNEIVRFSSVFTPEGVASAKSRDALQKDLGTIQSLIVSRFAFDYLRTPSEQTFMIRIKAAFSSLRSELRKGTITRDKFQVAIKRIRQLMVNFRNKKQIP